MKQEEVAELKLTVMHDMRYYCYYSLLGFHKKTKPPTTQMTVMDK